MKEKTRIFTLSMKIGNLDHWLNTYRNLKPEDNEFYRCVALKIEQYQFKLSDSLGATHQLHHCWMPRKFFDSSQCIKSRSAISGVIFMQQASDMCIKPYKIRSEIKSPLNHLLYRSFQKWLGYDLRLCIKSKLVMFQSEFRNECLNLAENGCFRLGHLYTYAVNGHIEEGGGY